MFKWKRHIAIVLALTMVLSLVPPLGLSVDAAAPRVTVDSLYTSTTMPTDLNKIPRLTTPTVNIAGTLQNVDPDQIGNLYYTIIQMDTSGNTIASQRVDNNKAIMPTNSSYQFNNVQLYEGLNKVIVSYAGGSTQNSVPAWVFYNAVPLISDLTVDDLPFDDGVRAPQTSTAAELITIRGKGNNLTSVTIKKLGSNEEVQARIDQRSGEFFISAGVNKLNSPDVLTLEPGDNKLLIVAKGEGNNVYQLERTLVFNYGSYAYNGTLQKDGTIYNLSEHPLIQYGSGDNLSFLLNARLKVDLESNRLKYPYMDLYINGNKYQTYNLDQNVQSALQVNEMLPNKVPNDYTGSLVFFGQGFSSLSQKEKDSLTLQIDGKVAANLKVLNDEVIVSDSLHLSANDGTIREVKILLNNTTMYQSSIRMIGNGIIKYNIDGGAPVIITDIPKTENIKNVNFESAMNMLSFRQLNGTYVNPQLTGSKATFPIDMKYYNYLRGNYKVEVRFDDTATSGSEVYTLPIVFATPEVNNYQLMFKKDGTTDAVSTNLFVPGSDDKYQFVFQMEPSSLLIVDSTQFKLQVLDRNGYPLSRPISLGVNTTLSVKDNEYIFTATDKNEFSAITAGVYQLRLTYGKHEIYRSDLNVGYPTITKVTPNELYLGYDDTKITFYGSNLHLINPEKLLVQYGKQAPIKPTSKVSIDGSSMEVDLAANTLAQTEKVVVIYNNQTISADSTNMYIQMKEPIIGRVSNNGILKGDFALANKSNHYAYFYAGSDGQNNLSNIYTDNLKWYLKKGSEPEKLVTINGASYPNAVKISDHEIAVQIPAILDAAGITILNQDTYEIYFKYRDAEQVLPDRKYTIQDTATSDKPLFYSYSVKDQPGKSYTYYGQPIELVLYGTNLPSSGYKILVDGKEVSAYSFNDTENTLTFSVSSDTATSVGIHDVKVQYGTDPVNEYSLRYEVKYPPLDYSKTVGITQVFGVNEYTISIPAKGVNLLTLFDSSKNQLENKLQAHILEPLADGTGYQRLPFTFNYNASDVQALTKQAITLKAENVEGVAPGSYRLLITYGKDVSQTLDYMDYNVFPNSQFIPFEVVAPTLTGLDKQELIKPASGTKTSLVFTGENLVDSTEYTLYLVQFEGNREAEQEVIATPKGSINQLIFNDIDFTSFQKDNYKIRVKYKNQVIGEFPFRISGQDATIRYNAQYSAEGLFNVYDFRLEDLQLPQDRKDQVITFVFRNATGQSVKKEYRLTLESGDKRYIESVNVKNVGPLNPDNNLLTESPIMFEVKVAKAGANTGVNLYLDGSAKPVASLNTQTGGVFKFDLPGVYGMNHVDLAEGNHTITFVPTESNVENIAGAKTYKFTYKPSPYVIFTNVYNNQIFDSFSALTKIEGRLVNVPSQDRDLVEVSINGVTKKLNEVDKLAYQNSSAFSIPISSNFVFNEEGKSTITFKIYTRDNQVTPIAVNSIDIFFFTTQVPDFQFVKPIDKNTPPRFPAGNKPDSYVTSAKKVELEGQFINASEITLTVRRYDENGVQKVQQETYLNDFSKREGDSRLFNGSPNIVTSSPKTVRFTTNSITLSDTGSTFLEFTIRNGGLTTTKTVEIVRQSEVFEIVKPNLNFSHVVNTNILEVQLIAEGADQVVYNKQPAIKQEIMDRDGNPVPGFVFRTKELKPNKDNKITFEVIRGAETFKGEFTVFFAEKAVPGAQYWTKLESTIYAFNKTVQMKVPKGTVLRRNDWKGEDFYLTPERDIVIAIAEQADGRVDRERQENPDGKIALTEPTGRFSPASPLYWIDAGTVSANEQDANISIRGRGQLPYEEDYFFRRNPADVMVPITNDKPVTLTMQYDENIRQGAWSYVTVYHFDYVEDHMGIKQWRWTNMGGVVDPKKHTITVPIKNFGFYQVMYMGRSFDDVINHPWGRDYLDTMYSKGYMKNVRDNEFGPNEPITRGEFATILVKSFEIPLDYEGGATFSDVQRVNPASRGLYDYKYIETAARAGIVRGGTGGRFYPDSPITREDAAVMIARAGDYKLDSALKAKPKAQKAYTDANIISEYALPSVMAVAKASIMEGKLRAAQQGVPESYYYDPRGNLTRAESAAIAMRVLQGAKKIPKQ